MQLLIYIKHQRLKHTDIVSHSTTFVNNLRTQTAISVPKNLHIYTGLFYIYPTKTCYFPRNLHLYKLIHCGFAGSKYL